MPQNPVPFAPETLETIQRALALATERRHDVVSLEHLLRSVTDEPQAQEMLAACDVKLETLRTQLDGVLAETFKPVPPPVDFTPELSLGLNRVLEQASLHAAISSAKHVDSGRLLVFLLQEEQSHAAYFLRVQGLDHFKLLQAIAHGGTSLQTDTTDLIARAATFLSVLDVNTPDAAETTRRHLVERIKLLQQMLAHLNRKSLGAANRRHMPTLLKPRDIHSHLSSHVVAQEKAKKVVATSAYKHLQRLHLTQSNPVLRKENVLLVGPTGTGKTFLVQTLAERLDVPVVIWDITSVTEAGYVGHDTEDILMALVHEAGDDVARAQTGIVFLDEIDKIAIRETGAQRDITGIGVQRSLLTMLQGGPVRISPNSWTRKDITAFDLNTNHIMFICAGNFVGIEEIVRKRMERTSPLERTPLTTAQLRAMIEPDDIIAFGFLPEFVGRLTSIGALHELSKDDIVAIANLTSGPIEEMKVYFSVNGVALDFELPAIVALAERALAVGTGARGLRSVLASSLEDALFEAASRRDICRCRVGREVILGTGRPVMLDVSGREVSVWPVFEKLGPESEDPQIV